ncbi:MAG TPA: hypothetical protein VMG39_15875 [Pseudolabrys sp.]|nr:hypothetical protein [Pseudolabrys sp.]
MQWSWSGRAWRAAQRACRPGLLLPAVCAMALAACSLDDHPTALRGGPRGATVAFESIDGPPPGQFDELVQALNSEAQTRRLAVTSRESPSAYRVRGYLSASRTKNVTTVSWVWDVFDNDGRRALRISGEETAKGHHQNAWAAADDAMLHRIAGNSMDQLAAFLTSPDIAPGTPDAAPRMALATSGESSPEAAGIFRIFRPNADPAPVSAGAIPASADGDAARVPLPPRRPPDVPVASAPATPTKLAASH